MNLDPGGGNDILGKNTGGLPSQDIASVIQSSSINLPQYAPPPDESAGWLGDLAAALGIAGATAGVGSELGVLGGAGGAAADTGATLAADAGASGLTDVGVGAATSGLGTLGAADTAGLSAGLADAGVSAGGAAGAADAIPEVTVTGTAPAGLAGGALPGMMLGAGVGLNALSINGGTVGPNPASDNSGSFLPATGASDISGLSSDLASSLGIDTGMPSIAGGGLSSFPSDITSFSPELSDVGTGAADAMPNLGGDSSLMSWLSNPKNLLRLGGLGLSGIQALSKPKLPGAAQTALNSAGPAVQQASSIIQSGGTATPIWAQQKASIDQSIDQQIQQQTESILQAAANSGMGDKNSGVVQQQIAQMQQNANVQRQQLYAQAQQQNVTNAVSELSGGNQTLDAIAQMQLAQSQEARQTATETARLALQLSQLVGD